MKAQTYFHIPTPCHENWDNMTPEGKGHFCGSCNKQVIDFSLMSDQQVLNYFKNASGKTCGRFANDQLERAMQPATQQKKKSWWVAAMMPLLVLFGKVNAQKKTGKVKSVSQVQAIPDSRSEIMGKVAPGIRPVKEEPNILQGDTLFFNLKTFTIGNVKDKKGNPVPYASIRALESFANTTTDSVGNFKLSLNNQTIGKLNIEVSSIGYETRIIEVLHGSKNPNTIILTQKASLLPDVIVSTGGYSKGKLSGAICIVRRVTYYNMLDTAWKKLFHNEAFKIFPNPVQKGSSVKLEIKNAGDYSIQVLDNSGKLVLIKNFTAGAKAITEIILPSSLTSGIYYIRLIDEKKKKQYTDKLIVQ